MALPKLEVTRSLRWSQCTITFNSADQLKCAATAGTLPMLCSPDISNVLVTKILIDSGAGLNVLSVEMFNNLQGPYNQLQPTKHFPGVTPRIRCARCLPVIRRRCHVICLRVALCHVILCISYHVVMCISFCIRVRLMHPSIFPVVRFAIRHSYVIRRLLLGSFRVWVLSFLGMARGLSSGLGIAPVDRLSSFAPFGDRLILQRLTG